MINSTFKYEDISQEDFGKYKIGELKERAERFNGKSFRKWSINEIKDVYLIVVKDTTFMDDIEFGTAFYVMNIQGLWVDFETETISHGGEYKGETWEKNAIKKVAPYLRDADGKKQVLEISNLPIAYETVISTFCEAFTAIARWWHDESIKHDVFFENLTQKVEV
jgi:hypothetical protein